MKSQNTKKKGRKNFSSVSKKNQRYFTSNIFSLSCILLLLILFFIFVERDVFIYHEPNVVGNLFAPISDRILDHLSDPLELNYPNSPQNLAKTWVISNESSSTIQRYILAVFYFSTQGDGWKEQTGWLTSLPECYWKGVICDKQNLVEMIWLDDNFLMGTLPLELAHLSNLNTIALQNNKISGSIPLTYFTELSNMQQISLYNNRLSGTLPEEMYDLDLEYVGLHNNILYGTIPTNIGKLKNLRVLYLHENYFTGIIPGEIVHAGSFVEIALEDNFLVGTLPSGLEKLQNLRWFSVQHNKLTGPIPASLGQIQALDTLYLYNNRFNGTVPIEICNNLEMKDFYTDCHINFPKVVCPCCTSCCVHMQCYET